MSKNRFTIDDAFESDDDEPIRIYGSTTESIPLQTKKYRATQPAVLQLSGQKEQSENSRESLLNSATAGGSKQRTDSLHSVMSTLSSTNVSTKVFNENRCWRHPKVRENYKVVLASVLLLFAGVVLIITGIAVECSKRTDVRSFIFFITGALCFIPGAYHIMVISCAIKGTRGFSFYQLPTIK